MALKKNIEINNTSIIASYWKIDRKSDDFLGDCANVVMGAYVDEAARRKKGAQPFTSRDFLLEGDDYEPDMTREQVYGKLKQFPEFKGAEDV